MTSRERRGELTARSRKISELVPRLQYAVHGHRRRDGTYSTPRIVSRETEQHPLHCGCPSFEHEGDCRHVAAVEHRLKGGTTEGYPDLDPDKRPIYPQDNPRRKAARRLQERIIVPLLRSLLELVFPLPVERKQGRQFTDIVNVILGVVIRTVHCKSGDLAQSYIETGWETVLLRTTGSNSLRPPSVEALTSSMTRSRTVRAMKRVIAELCRVVQHIPESGLMDGTEYNIPIRDRRAPVPADANAEQKRKHQIMTVKINYLVGDKTKMIFGPRAMPGKKHDSKRTRAILADALQIKRFEDLVADKAFLSDPILDWLKHKNIRAIIPPKANTKGKKSGLLREHVAWWNATPPEAKNYGRRQNVEATHSSDKRINGENLRSKKFVSQAVEMYSHVIVQNLRQLIWLYLNETIDGMPFMQEGCRQQLERVRRRLSGLPRPDLSPRYRDGLKPDAA